MALKLDEDYNGSTLLNDWWQKVKSNFALVKDAIEQEVGDRQSAILGEKAERDSVIGKLTDLHEQIEDKTSLVAAINETFQDMLDTTDDIYTWAGESLAAAIDKEVDNRNDAIAEVEENIVKVQEDLEDINKQLSGKYESVLLDKINALEKNKHTHDNKSVLDGITAEKVAKWDSGNSTVSSGSSIYLMSDYSPNYTPDSGGMRVYAQGKPDDMPLGIYIFEPEQEVDYIYLVSADGENELATYAGKLYPGTTYMIRFGAESSDVIAEFRNTDITEINEAIAMANEDIDALQTALGAKADENDLRTAEVNIKSNAEAIAEIKSEIEEATAVDGIVNLFNPNDPDVMRGYTTDSTENNIHASETWAITGYIPVNPGDNLMLVYYVDGIPAVSGGTQKPFFDADKNLVSKPFQNSQYITIPEGVAYVRWVYRLANEAVMMIVKATQAPAEYVAYGAKQRTSLAKKLSNIETEATKKEGAHWNEKVWYAYGTSLTSTAQGKYADYVAQFSGMTLNNKGIPGGGIINNTNVKAAIMNTDDGKTAADLITLEVGANDTSAIIGEIYDTGDDTFCGALNQCIRYLQENTTAQIVVISSTTSRYSSGDSSVTHSSESTFGSDNHTKFDQWEAIRKVCRINGVPYIPMGEESGLGLARMGNEYLIDNIHHTDLGGYNLAMFIWSRLKNIPCWYTSVK